MSRRAGSYRDMALRQRRCLSATCYTGRAAGYAVVDAARTSGRGSGVAIIFHQELKCSRVAVPNCCTLEVICVRLTTSSGPVIIMNVYRPGSEKPSASFFDELASVLETLVTYSCPVVVGGDFNVCLHHRPPIRKAPASWMEETVGSSTSDLDHADRRRHSIRRHQGVQSCVRTRSHEIGATVL